VAFFGKPLLSTVVSLWSRLNRMRRTGNAVRFPDLRFVGLPKECILAVTQRDDPGPNVQIFIHWNVTNASASGIPARLLRARLAKPRVRDSEAIYIHTGSTNGRVYPNEEIPTGATRRLTIVFLAVLPSDRVKKPIKVKVIVVDQFSREHRLRPIRLQPININPATQ
jgi:hypothetical protein